MTLLLWKILLGAFGAAIISMAAYIGHYLTKSGAIAVWLLGTLIYAYGSFSTYALLFLLFGSSIVIQLYRKIFFPTIQDCVTVKTHARDVIQILANGAVPCLLLILYFYTDKPVFLLSYVSCLAGSCADTWASEIGILANKCPVMIISRKKVEQGLSGGVTLLGSGASFGGSLLISGSFTLFMVWSTENRTAFIIYFFLPLFVGWCSAFFDSILGEVCQATYYDQQQKKYTEKPLTNGQENPLIKGWKWCTNDSVNFLTSLFSACTTFFLYFSIS